MVLTVSRRRVLALGVGALAGCLSNPRERRSPTDAGDESTPGLTTTASTARTTEPGCDPVNQAWGSREETPTVPPCPEKPETLNACSVRAFALGLEKRRRYRSAIGRHGQISAVNFNTYTATVTEAGSGSVVSARLYFTVRTATGTQETETAAGEARTHTATENTTAGSTAEPTGIYDVSYYVTADSQWRAIGTFETESALRQAGSEIECGSGA